MWAKIPEFGQNQPFLATIFLSLLFSYTQLGSTTPPRDCQQCFDSSRLSTNQRMVFRLKNSSQPIRAAAAHVIRTSDHLLDDQTPESQDMSPRAHRIRPVSVGVANTNRYPNRGRRRQRTTSTTTSTTTTTTAPPEDYYDDYYDEYDDYLTTTTTTAAPKRRRGGRRRFRPTEPPTTTTTTTLSPGYISRPDGRVIDYLADPNFPYELKGTDLTEYPFYISIPENKFDCRGRHDGYYANIDLKCQVYHHCAVGHQRYDFLCPNYTLFDQTTFTCRFINTVDCLSSENHYNRNNELYVESTTPSTTTQTTGTTPAKASTQ